MKQNYEVLDIFTTCVLYSVDSNLYFRVTGGMFDSVRRFTKALLPAVPHSS